MDKTKVMGIARAITAGVVASLVIALLIGVGLWLHSVTKSDFGPAFLLVIVLVSLSIVLGYFSSSETTVIGYIGRWKQELAILFPLPPDEDDVLRDARRTRDLFALIAIAGIAAIFIYALQWKSAGFAQIFGNSLLLALASLVTGLFFGFLFGIPRTLQEGEPAPAQAGASGGQAASPATSRRSNAARLGVNTNLEQISDWLTKIIVGLGLIHLKDFPRYVDALLTRVVKTLNGDRTFALAILVAFSVTGFLLGYLLTRLYLTRALARALLRAEQTAEIISRELARIAADVAANPTAAQQGADVEPVSPAQKVAAEKLEQVAQTDKEQLRTELTALAREYENIRLTRQSGSERTRLMEVVAAKMRGLSLALYDQLPAFMASGSPGERLAAVVFLQVKPSVQSLSWLEQRFSSEKPFITYHAAWAIRHAVRQLPKSELPSVIATIKRVLAFYSTQPIRDRETADTLTAALAEAEARAQE